MSISFRFHPEKAIEAAAMLLKLHGKPMKYIGLLKMLYIADRIALERMDQPITGDKGYSLDWGLVPSNVYNLIKGNSVDNALPLWQKYISKNDDGYTVSLKASPPNDYVSEKAQQIIKEVYEKYGHLNPFDLAMLTHDFPEWEDPHGSSIPVNVDNVLRYMNKPEEEIEAIRQEAAREAYLDMVLAA
ncbi:MAG: SocA family protein [Pseudanabaena sp. CAN_BIN31]|nr:SocA family protein [Pseudanabaena sp. CAN_BIN31]